MRYWVRWEGAGGSVGERIGPFRSRGAAEAARRDQLRAAAAALERGTGVAGTWTPDGALFRDDLLDEMPLGRYAIEIEE